MRRGRGPGMSGSGNNEQSCAETGRETGGRWKRGETLRGETQGCGEETSRAVRMGVVRCSGWGVLCYGVSLSGVQSHAGCGMGDGGLGVVWVVL
jgi:hypothetical protein